MFSSKKEKTEEEKEKARFAELEAVLLEEEKEHYYLLKEAYRKIKEGSNGVTSKKRLELENHLSQIVKDLGDKVETLSKS